MQKAEFNMSFDFLIRVNVVFYSLDEAISNRDLEKWSDCLVILYMELHPYMNKDEKQRAEKDIREIRDTSFEMMARKDKHIPKGMYWKMINFALLIKSVMKRNNMELKMGDDPRLALMN